MLLSLNQSSKVEPTHQGLGTGIALGIIETYKPYHHAKPKVTSPEWRTIFPPIENKLCWAVITIANELSSVYNLPDQCGAWAQVAF